MRRFIVNRRRFVANPTPREGESTDDFISRCMSDTEAMEDFPDQDQRLAFCFSEARAAGRDVPEPADNAATNVRRESLTLAVQLAGASRTEMLWNREFRVFPAVLVQEQVLNNNLGRAFLPTDEIAASVDAWNMMPVVVDHPMRNGVPVSAREPEILNRSQIGFIFRTKMDGAKLKADILIDPQLVPNVDSAENVINNVESGGRSELSTGFAANIEQTGGRFGDEEFDLIMRDIEPDHLALLSADVGACSVQAGCGLGVNQQQQQTNPERVRSWILRRYHETLDSFNRWIGRTDARQQSDEDRRMQIQEALQDSFGGANTRIFIDSMFSDDNAVVFERFNESNGQFDLMRVSFSIEDGSVTFDGEPEPVRRVTTFEPAANADGTSTLQTGEVIMNRAEMIRRLVANGTLDEAALARLSDAQLQALVGVNAQGGGDPPAPQPTATATATNAGGDENFPSTLPADASDRERLAWNYAQRYRRERDEAVQRLEPAATRIEEERAGLIDDLLYARNRAYDDDEIRAMNVDQLRKLHKTIYGDRSAGAANYAGRGVPGGDGAGGGSFGFVSSIMTGGRDSALRAKN